MRPKPGTHRSDPHRPFPGSLRAIFVVMVLAAIVVGGDLVLGGSTTPDLVDDALVDEEVGAQVAAVETSTTTTAAVTTTLPPAPGEPPPPGPPPSIPPTESEPAAKQLAADIAYFLTTYGPEDDHPERLQALAGRQDADSLAGASAPLTYPGSWSRGEVVYPQMGGLNEERSSVMVVTRQTVGTGAEPELSVVRTLDIRLVRNGSGWEFDFLASAGGTFDSIPALTTAHAVAADPRIVMPDSARLDILSGLVSPTLLEVMSDLAEQAPFEVVVLATGHPDHVFDTDRVSHHTVGQAVDINRIGDRLVIDDRGPGSRTGDIVQWLYDHPEVLQVGSPWDIDGVDSRRSFTDEVHQDHIHLAVDD